MGQYGTFALKLYSPLKDYMRPCELVRRDSCAKCNSCCRKFDSLMGPVTVAELISIVWGTEVPLSDSEYYRYGWRNPKDIGDEEVRTGTGYCYCAIRIKSPAVRFTDEEYEKIITSAKRRKEILAPIVYRTWEVTLNCFMTKPEIKWGTRTVIVEGRSAGQANANAEKLLNNSSDCAYAMAIETVQKDGVRLHPVFETKCADCKYCECNNGTYFCKRFGVNVEEYESCPNGKENETNGT